MIRSHEADTSSRNLWRRLSAIVFFVILAMPSVQLIWNLPRIATEDWDGSTTSTLEIAARVCFGLLGLGIAVFGWWVSSSRAAQRTEARAMVIPGFVLVGLFALSLVLSFFGHGAGYDILTSRYFQALTGGVAIIGGGYWLADRYWINPRG